MFRKRGIGLTTINRIQESAPARGIGFYDALSAPDLIPGIGRSASKLDSFAALIEYFKGRSERERGDRSSDGSDREDRVYGKSGSG